ncbi:MAG: pyridoxal-dependent decarboxylase, partial [Rubrobacter sp.]|nr:pyridoxal-dependent decarboxylase [Rubrobacter sp.]
MTRQISTEQPRFLSGSEQSLKTYRAAMKTARETVEERLASLQKPYSGASPQELTELFDDAPLPEEGEDLNRTLREVGGAALANSVAVSHPRAMAHLHCPPLVAALAAEHLISAANQSLDSWDQSPSATILEQKLVRWLCDLFGINEGRADGVFTSGGSQSNLMGLLLARNRYARDWLGVDVQRDGLPPEASRLRILCSEAAHFTVRQSAALLGLGESAVVAVRTDERQRMSPRALDARLDELDREGLLPIAVVGTAGTTDFGSIDPLEELADRAVERELWLHVDAAYGGALILSDE